MERDNILYKIRRSCQVVAHKLFSDEFMSKLYFKIVLKEDLDLKNPKTFNEKLQWLKLYYFPNNELVVKCTDKYDVRKYIKDKGYEKTLVPLLGEWDNPRQIKWEELPDQFVLKCNHGCAYNLICNNKKEFNREKAEKQLNTWLKEDFGSFNIELHYSKIKHHKIICEEFLSEELMDYKFFCFNGEPKFIYVSRDLIHDRQAKIGFFNLDGSKMKLQRDDYENIEDIEIPSFYNEMLEMATKLSKEFPFVRVDFFVTKSRYYFAELTFTPSACMMPFNPKNIDLEWGKLLDIKKEIKEYENNKTISIIGHFGGNKEFLDGQTVKTKILYEELTSKTKWKILKVDTYYKNKNPLKLLFQTLKTIIKSDDIIVLLSGNGMRIYFPILYFCSKFFGKRIYHDVIGGNLDYYVKKYPKYKTYLNEFRYNWVETEGLKNKLEKLKIMNCEVIPNFKRLNIVSEKYIDKMEVNKNCYKFCTFSRVMKEKGISEAIDVINKLNNEKYQGKTYLLDIFGSIDPNYKEEFESKLKYSSKEIKYCGKVPYYKSVDILKQYDVLLFPTYWNGEGFPGTIVDAFSAGVPVIATNWNYNLEIVKDNINGMIYSKKDDNGLINTIKKVVLKNNLRFLKKNAITEAQNYLPEKYINEIIEFIK